MKPKIQKPINFDNRCNAKYIHSELEAALLWYADGEILTSKRVIYLFAGYPAISIDSKKIYAHRVLYAWKLKRYLKKNEYVKHKDGNNLNIELCNLEL